MSDESNQPAPAQPARTDRPSLREIEAADNEALRTWIPFAIIAVVALAITYVVFVEPPPPDTIRLVTGSPNGAYTAYGKRYKELIEEHGFKVKIVHSKGSVDNLQQLQEPDGPELAFVQGGVGERVKPAAREQIQALGSLYSEPLWVFHRREKPLQMLNQIEGMKVAVGPKGSGTRPVALQLLKANGVTEKGRAVQLLDQGGSKAAEALREGKADVAFFVTGPKASYIAPLISDPNIELLDFRRADAYARTYPYLGKVELSEGLVDLRRNLPRRTVHMLGPKATLVARADLSPALIPVLMDAIQEVHNPGNLIDEAEAFPSAQFVEFPLNDQARRYIKRGPSLIYRWLPFWLASIIDRLAVLMVPLLTLVIPLGRIGPPVYRWRMRNRIYRWYSDIRDVDIKLASGFDRPDDLDYMQEKLMALENELLEDVKVPLSFMEEFYNLRLHVEFLQERVEEFQETSREKHAQAEAAHAQGLQHGARAAQSITDHDDDTDKTDATTTS